MLISSNKNENELISTLVKPHVSKFVARTLGNQNNYSGNGLRLQLQAQRAMKPPLQAQHQFQAQRAIQPPLRAQHQLQAQRAIYPPLQAHQLQDKRMIRNQNSTVQGSTQAIRVQTQTVWRPKSDQ